MSNEDPDITEPSQHTNDADTRPRVYISASNSDGSVDVVVKGSEGETSDDIEEKAKEIFNEAVEAEKEIHKQNDSLAYQ